MFRIFKEFLPHLQTYQGDGYALWLNIIGNCLIGITFLLIGVVCVKLARVGKRGKRREMLTRMLGFFLISCSFSRFIGLLCIWHNAAILDGWIKILTGFLAFFALTYLPNAIRETRGERKLEETNQLLEKTKKDLQEVIDIHDKLNNK